MFEIYCVLLCVEELGQKFGPTCMPENHKKGNQNISGQLSRPQRNTYSLRTNFGQSLIRINEPRHSIICPSKRRESWSRFILSVTQENFRSTPLALCTFYPLILSRFSTTSSHNTSAISLNSFCIRACRKDKAMLSKSQSTESPTYFRPLPSFLSEVFDLPGVA